MWRGFPQHLDAGASERERERERADCSNEKGDSKYVFGFGFELHLKYIETSRRAWKFLKEIYLMDFPSCLAFHIYLLSLIYFCFGKLFVALKAQAKFEIPAGVPTPLTN